MFVSCRNTHKKVSISEEFKLNVKTRILVDLTKSKERDGRLYSIKQKVDRGSGAKWYRVATLQQFGLTDCRFVIKKHGSKSRETVLNRGTKDVHAFIEGNIEDETPLLWDTVIKDRGLRKGGYSDAEFVSYDPFKRGDFVVSHYLHLPSTEACGSLPTAQKGASVFCFESSILYLR